jgi:hypothetical protein
LWRGSHIETKPQRLKPIFIAFVSARFKPCPDKSSDYVRSFAHAHPGRSERRPYDGKGKGGRSRPVVRFAHPGAASGAHTNGNVKCENPMPNRAGG